MALTGGKKERIVPRNTRLVSRCFDATLLEDPT